MPPLVGVAVKVTEVPVQIEVLLAAIVTEGVTEAAVIVMALLVAVTGFAQGSLLVITTLTTSPLDSVVLVKVGPVCPAIFIPFITHWYVGLAPPLVGIALKVTGLPVQIEVLLAVIVTEGITVVDEIVMALLLTVTGLAQGSTLVITTLTTLPLARVVLVNVAPV